jgi:ABC-2 type transport system permease protein
VLGAAFVVGNMVFLLPGEWGEELGELRPGHAGSVIATPVSSYPGTLSPWAGFVFAAEVAVVLAVGYAVLRRRDA